MLNYLKQNFPNGAGLIIADLEQGTSRKYESLYESNSESNRICRNHMESRVESLESSGITGITWNHEWNH